MIPQDVIRRCLFRLVLCMVALAGGSGRSATPYEPVFGDPLIESWRWGTFPELNGLNAQCVTEGTDGRMWFGTSEGVWESDGINWTFHPTSLLGGSVAICPGPGGSLLACGQRGIARFVDGRWQKLFPGTNQSFGDIRKLAAGREGELWAATAWGLLRARESQWTLYTSREIADRLSTNPVGTTLRVELLPDAVLTRARTNARPALRYNLAEVGVDPRGRIWLGTDGGEVLCFDDAASQDSTNIAPASPAGSWTLYNESDGLVCGQVPSILPLRDGTVWVVYGAGSGHLNVFDGTRWQATRLLDAGASEDCSNPIQTRDGAIWLSSRYVIYAFRNGRWRAYQQPEVPIPTARNFLFQSADGALWIGGPGTEIHRVDYQTPRWLTLRDLNFHWESPAGAQWFLHRSGRVVVRAADQWLSYGVEDGLIDAPVALLGTRSGEVWVAGSHQQTAATARFDGQQWTRFIHDELSWGIDWRGALAAADGSLWFAAAVDTSGPRQHRAGLLQFRNGEWLQHHQPGRAPRNGDDRNPATLLPATQRPEPIGKFLCLGESPDGRIWAGRNILAFQDGNRWNLFASSNISFGIIETLFTGQGRELWIGTRQFGALRFDGREWRQFQGKESLVANSVRGLAQTEDGSIWAATDRGFSRFDGQTWTADMLPEDLLIPHEGGSLKAGKSGSLWINQFAPEWNRRAWSKGGRVDVTNCEFWTVCHRFQGVPPETTITSGNKTVAYPGSMSVFWSGTAAWREPKEARLQFSHRLDGGAWSAFSTELGHAFLHLPSGEHLLEVRARDRGFNVDPTPAALRFVVLPPVWRQGWFLLLMVLLGGAVATQSLRVLRERRRLHEANRVLAAGIEDRKRAEAAVRKSEALYRSFITASPDGIAVVDPSGVLRFASLRVYELLGRGPEQDLTGTNALERIAPEDRERARASLAAAATGEAVTTTQLALLQEDGTRLFVEINGAPLLGPDGQPTGIVTMLRDATARRRAEAEIRKLTEDLEQRVEERTTDLQHKSDELQESQRALMNLVEDLNEKAAALEAVNQELQAFSYSVSHDLRAPLRGIDGFSQALVEDHGDKLDDEGRHYLQRIRAGAQRMGQLIDDMLNLCRVTRGEMRMERVPLSGLVQEIANDLIRREPERQVRFVIAPDVAVTGDARFLRVALENLLGNAWKFTSRRPEATIEFGVTQHDGQRAYFVRDNGAGFNMQYAGKLFGAFQRLHTVEQFPGTGVGLATVKRIIHRHGGRVWAVGELERGATFFFSLPPRTWRPEP